MDPVALQTELTQLVEKLNTMRKAGKTINLVESERTYKRIIKICNQMMRMGVEPKGGNKTRRTRRKRGTRRH